MNAWECDNSDSMVPTIFDETRLSDMEIGATVEGEIGNWKVLRYQKVYVMIPMGEAIRKHTIREFTTLEKLIKHLTND